MKKRLMITERVNTPLALDVLTAMLPTTTRHQRLTTGHVISPAVRFLPHAITMRMQPHWMIRANSLHARVVYQNPLAIMMRLQQLQVPVTLKAARDVRMQLQITMTQQRLKTMVRA